MNSSSEQQYGDDLPSLGPSSRHGLALIRRRGMVWFVGLLSTVASLIALSVALTVAFIFDFESPYKMWTAVLSGLIPFLIAPWMLYANGMLVVHLDEASRLLKESSLTDPLTGTRNRRGFFSEVESISAEKGTEFCVTIVDIDEFKQVNDTHGHAIGDAGLCLVSSWLQQQVGERGIVARMGGDEFVAVSDPEAVCDVPGTMDFMHRGVTFTASVGTAPYYPAEQNVEEALAAADISMYARKGARRSMQRDQREHREHRG